MNKRCIISFITLILLSAYLITSIILSISHAVNADMGPKPSITVTVENGPDEYFVALLENRNYGLENTVESSTNEKLENVTEESVYEYLKKVRFDGYVLFESPVGDNIKESNKVDNPEEIYYFTYMVPSDFRVIVISKDGTISLSEPHTKNTFNSKCTYDVATSTIVEERSNSSLRNILTVASCFILTIISELLLLLAFRYPFSKRNLLTFFIVNALTNIPYTILMITLGEVPGIFLIIAHIILENIITIIESLVYCFTLKNKENEVRYGKNILYGIVANLTSNLIGFVIVIIRIIIF